MGWQKRVHIDRTEDSVSKFSESEFKKIITPVCGHVQEVCREMINGQLSVLIVFQDKADAEDLDKEELEKLTSEHLADDGVKIHIQAGGVGTPY